MTISPWFGPDRIVDLEGKLLTREDLTFEAARAIHHELRAKGVSHKWERWSGPRVGWSGVSAYWAEKDSTVSSPPVSLRSVQPTYVSSPRRRVVERRIEVTDEEAERLGREAAEGEQVPFKHTK